MRRTNKQLFGKFISNNLAAFSKSQRYSAGTLLLCSVASAAYYYAENSKENREPIDWWKESQVNELEQRYVVREHQEKRKISADNNQDLKPAEIKDRDDASSETSPRGRFMDLGYDPRLNETVLGNKPKSEVWDLSEFKYYKNFGVFRFDKPVKNKELTLDEFVEKRRLIDAKKPQGLWTGSGEYIPPEKVGEYFAAARRNLPCLNKSFTIATKEELERFSEKLSEDFIEENRNRPK